MEFLFARHTPKRGHVALMLVGSLVFHGGLVGVAALFMQPPPDKVFVEWTPPGDGDPTSPGLPPEVVLPTDTTPEPTTTPDVLAPEIPAPPVPMDEPDFADAAAPTPRQQRTAVKPVTTARMSSVVRSASSASTAPGNGITGTPSSNPAAGVSAIPWVMPHPPYPAFLRGLSAVSVTVRITTDAAGRISDVAIARSTGNAALDAYTVGRVRGTWRGPANASRTTEFVYQLR